MNDAELTKKVQEISLESFGIPFTHQAFFNSRLKTTGGRYRLKDHNIEINPKMIAEYDYSVFEGIVKHELCHYHLHLANCGYQHKDRDFKRLLKRVGASRYAPAAARKYRYVYQCSNCKKLYYRKRKVDMTKYVCSQCRGQLTLKKLNQKN
ncbi:SprT family protein [Ligilactobacillus sp. WILCCON 0076]|uniref:SprT family protein n=1 Tax=Ligilactobacillus ubinensis TaxID=2876789 RepID=A0A9X2FKS8_9LACO|nr:SprT family protein [Ligilactobacillus ubinensis]MCP0887509.1 SprT family protein [Ligilactobacillus ubinensis]